MVESIRRACALLRAAVACAVLAVASPRAEAQGDDAFFPGAISSGDLGEMADRLGLSRDQRAALEPLHDRYKQAYLALRDGDIEKIVQEFQAFMAGIPDRATVERILRRMDEANGRIESIDNQFFESVVPILTQSQQHLLSRVKVKRSRQRHSLPMVFLGSPEPADLSDVFIEQKIDPTLPWFPAVDASLETYEQRSAGHLETMHRSMSRVLMDVIEAMEAAGMLGQNPEDLSPEQMEQFQAVAQQAMLKATERQRRSLDELRQVTLSTMREMVALMPPAEGRKFRNAALGHLYPQLQYSILNQQQDWFGRARSLKDLTPAQANRISELELMLNERIDALMTEAVRDIEAFEKDRNPFEWNQEAWQAHNDKIQALATKAVEEQKSVVEMLAQELGTDWESRAMVAAGPAEAQFEVPPGDTEEQLWPGDQLLPRRLTSGGFRKLLAKLQAPESLTDVLDSIHQDYASSVESCKEIEHVRTIATSIWQMDPATNQQVPPEDKDLDELMTARREAMKAMLAREDELFANVGAVIDPSLQPTLALLAKERRVMMYQSAGDARHYYGGGADHGGHVNLLQAIGQVQLEAAQKLDALRAAPKYLESILAKLPERFDAIVESQRAQEAWSAMWMRSSRDGREFDQGAYERILAPSARRLTAIRTEIRDLNKAGLDEIASGAPELAGMVRKAYQTLAYPGIFQDGLSVHAQLEKAAQLPDLTEVQRAELDEMALNYVSEYEQLNQRVIELVAGSEPIDGFNTQNIDWEARNELARKVERIGFERSELSMRTANRLKAMLTPEQLAALPPLPDPRLAAETRLYW